MESNWEKIITCLSEHLSEPAFQTFLSSSTLINTEDNILTIEVPNEFSKEWIRDKCEPIIREMLPDIGTDIVFNYLINKKERPKDTQISFFEKPIKHTPSTENKIEQFNSKYVFKNFIVGHHNRFAYASSEAVSKAPASAYNPLFIYGSVGLGKTHLLHAIGLRISETFPTLKSKLVSCEKFTNELIYSIKEKKVDQFRAKYRKVDILLVDDVQFLARKEQTQEEFFHTFNDLYNSNKQIILTSDRPPKEISTLEDRLRTRFEWGLIADIQPPDLETRIAILTKKKELNHFKISEEILHFIASQIPSNVREMEGALTRIVAYASLLNTEVTLSIASNVIRDMVGIKQEKPLTISVIQKYVCDYFNVSMTDLNSKTRSKEIVYARQIAMYLSRELTPLSLPKIGESFGNRDHSTVMHSCDKIKSIISQNEDTKNEIQILISNIKSSND
jgi:chromosomal replication initiator protein